MLGIAATGAAGLLGACTASKKESGNNCICMNPTLSIPTTLAMPNIKLGCYTFKQTNSNNNSTEEGTTNIKQAGNTISSLTTGTNFSKEGQKKYDFETEHNLTKHFTGLISETSKATVDQTHRSEKHAFLFSEKGNIFTFKGNSTIYRTQKFHPIIQKL